jgi:hypothetical protein
MKIIVLLFLISLSFAFRLNTEALKKRGINVEQIVNTVGEVAQVIDNGKVALQDNQLENGVQTFVENIGKALNDFGSKGNEEVGDMDNVGDDDGNNEDSDEFLGISSRKALGTVKEISHARQNKQLETRLQTFLENVGKALGKFGPTDNGGIGDLNNGDDASGDDESFKINTRKTCKIARKIYQILHDNQLENNAQEFLENLGQALANYGTPDTSNIGDIDNGENAGGDDEDDELLITEDQKTQTTAKIQHRHRKCRGGMRRIFKIARKIAKFMNYLKDGKGEENKQFRRRFLNYLKGGKGQKNRQFSRRFLNNLLGAQGHRNRQRKDVF